MAAGDITDSMLGQVRLRLREPAAAFWTDAEVLDYLNKGQMALAAEEALDAAMLPLTEVRAATFVSATFSYALPYDFLRERFVSLGGVPCQRVELVDLDALRTNVFFAPTAARPFYSIQDGGLTFHTNSEDPATLTYEVYYVRKPMWVRAVTSISAGGAVVTAAVHNLTTAAHAGDILRYEDRTEGGAAAAGVNAVVATAAGTAMTLGGWASGASTGGRLVHTVLGQMSTDEDPLLPAVFRGAIMDFAVSRCWAQRGERAEAGRNMAHYLARVETLKSRYGGGRPHDDILGDPARRTAPGGG
jgi:hypothetical protein